MNNKKNILVFPCGSEIGLEIHRSLEFSTHFNLLGASSVDDHGKFVYKNYFGNLPFIDRSDFIPSIKKIVREQNIDAIYPAMDLVITALKKNEIEIGCKIISSEIGTTEVCLSKSKTYENLKGKIATPILFKSLEDVKNFPVFLKPDIGYGSRGVFKAEDKQQAIAHLSKHSNCLIMEYLPGREYTVDCFTDFNGKILFIGPRERKRISNGISVNTKTMPLEERFQSTAVTINDNLKLNGAWFFQVKENQEGNLVLMEIASRLGGSSGVYRAKGINFAAMSIFNAFQMPVSVLENNFDVEMDRALNNKYKIDINFKHVYVDFDDTLLVDGKVNAGLIGILYSFLNEGKKIYLITKHTKDINQTLYEYRLSNLFDNIIHLKKSDEKWKFITHKDAIFIDDSYAERKAVFDNLKISIFGVDNIYNIVCNDI